MKAFFKSLGAVLGAQAIELKNIPLYPYVKLCTKILDGKMENVKNKVKEHNEVQDESI